MSLAHPAGNCRVKLCRSKIGEALVVATWNPAASSGYYTQQTEYYTRGREPPGLWYAPANDLGVVDGTSVDEAVFEHLFAGRDKDGNPLSNTPARMAGRVPAFDVTLSAPRSVSLVWALADDAMRAAIDEAQARAVRATLRMLEREAAFARRGRGGSRIERVGLTAACFQHGESRPAEHADGQVFADMNLHTHAVIVNMATRADGTVGALHSVVLRNAKLAAGATYHVQLAAGLQDLGFAIDRVAKNGIFEIEGVSDAAISFFSARRREIEAELAKTGTTSGQAVALAAKVACKTRGAKALGERPRDEIWRDAASRIGFDLAPVFAKQQERLTRFERSRDERLFAERLAALPRALTETRSIVERRELVRAVAEAAVGTGFGAERAATVVDVLLADGHVVELGSDALGLPRFSTPEMIRVEREAAAMAVRLGQRLSIGLDPADVRGRAAAHGLSSEQLDAALAATGPVRLAVIEGAPGTGKTTTLRPIVEAWRAAGYRVVGAATAWKVANALRDDLGIEARATASWLARAELDKPFLDERSVLIIDEAGLIGSREMRTLLAAVEVAGARLVAVGDRGQLQSIGAGSGLAILAGSTEAARVGAIVRQREAWEREAVTAFGRGAAAEALEAFAGRGRLVEADGAQAAIRAAVDEVEANLLGNRSGSALIVVKTNAEAAAVGQEVRRRLREHGLLEGEDVVVDAIVPSGRPAALTLAAGDRVRFLARNDAIGVVNGTVATVTRVVATEPREGPVGASPRHARVETTIEGRHVRFDTRDLADGEGRARIGWAYASTIYGAQGVTVERAAVLLTSRFDRHDVYVAASRARDATTLVVDRRAIEHEIGTLVSGPGSADRERTPARPVDVGAPEEAAQPRGSQQTLSGTLHALTVAASEGVDEAIAAASSRRAFLASRMAKAHRKETTLDRALPAATGLTLAEPQALNTLEQKSVLAPYRLAEHPVAALEAPATAETARRCERRREHGLEL